VDRPARTRVGLQRISGSVLGKREMSSQTAQRVLANMERAACSPTKGVMPVTQVIILNGAMGVGKTTTARELTERLAPALFLDADHVADFRPFDVCEPAHLDYIEDTLCHLLAFHAANGFERIIIAWVFETPERLERFTARLREQDHGVQAFRLTCAADEHERRVRMRARENLHWEMTRHRELARGLAIAASRGYMGRVVDVTEMRPDEAADAIADALSE
jgi:hypothetical protein